jgi:hypothetical protein
MSKANSSVHHNGHRASTRRLTKPSAKAKAPEAMLAAAKKVFGNGEHVGKRMALGAAALGTAAVVTAGVFERRLIVKVLSNALARTEELGQSMAVATGLRRKPIYMRALPAIGIALGLVAAGSTAFFLVPRMRQSAASPTDEPQTERPSGEATPWSRSDPRLGIDRVASPEPAQHKGVSDGRS